MDCLAVDKMVITDARFKGLRSDNPCTRMGKNVVKFVPDTFCMTTCCSIRRCNGCTSDLV